MKILLTISVLISTALSFPGAVEAFVACGPLPADHYAKDKVITTYRDGRIGVECPSIQITAPKNIKTLVDIAGVDGGQGWGTGTYNLPIDGAYNVRILQDGGNEVTKTGCTGTILYGETKQCVIEEVQQQAPTLDIGVNVEADVATLPSAPTPASATKTPVPQQTQENTEQIKALQTQVIELQKIVKQLLVLLIERLQAQR